MLNSVRAPAIQRLVGDASRLIERAGNHAYAFRIPSRVADIGRLNRVYRRFGRVHEIIRTVIARDESGEWRCSLAPEDTLAPIETYTLGPIADPRTIAEIGAIAQRPMRPAEPPHYDLMLFECGGEWVLVTRGHHIVLDGASRLTMMLDLVGDDAPSDEPPPEAASDTLARLNAWEASLLSSSHARRTLARAESALLRVGGRQILAYPPGALYSASRLSPVQAMNPRDTDRLVELCRMKGLSLFGLCLSAFSVALGEFSGQEAHLICIPYSVRYPLRIPKRIGNFTDYLFVEVSADPLNEKGPKEASAAVLTAAREFLPLQCVTETVVGADRLGPNPFLRISAGDMTGGDEMPSPLLAMPGDASAEDPDRFETIPIPTATVPFEMQDVGIMVCRRNGELRWRIGARRDVFSAEVIETLSQRMETRLHAALTLHEA